MADEPADEQPAPPVKIVIATFGDERHATRALASLAPGLDDGVGMAAIVARSEVGKIRFVETHDRTAGQGALHGGGLGAIGGLIGLAFGPFALLGAPVGMAVGALIGKLRDTGFDDNELKGLGEDLPAGSAALIATLGDTDVARAIRLLTELQAQRVLIEEIDAELSHALDEIARPLPPPLPPLPRRDG